MPRLGLSRPPAACARSDRRGVAARGPRRRLRLSPGSRRASAAAAGLGPDPAPALTRIPGRAAARPDCVRDSRCPTRSRQHRTSRPWHGRAAMAQPARHRHACHARGRSCTRRPRAQRHALSVCCTPFRGPRPRSRRRQAAGHGMYTGPVARARARAWPAVTIFSTAGLESVPCRPGAVRRLQRRRQKQAGGGGDAGGGQRRLGLGCWAGRSSVDAHVPVVAAAAKVGGAAWRQRQRAPWSQKPPCRSACGRSVSAALPPSSLPTRLNPSSLVLSDLACVSQTSAAAPPCAQPPPR